MGGGVDERKNSNVEASAHVLLCFLIIALLILRVKGGICSIWGIPNLVVPLDMFTEAPHTEQVKKQIGYFSLCFQS